MFHQCFGDYKKWGNSSGFERIFIDYEGTRSELRGAEIESVRLITLTENFYFDRIGRTIRLKRRTVIDVSASGSRYGGITKVCGWNGCDSETGRGS